jgi:hypothetical protein
VDQLRTQLIDKEKIDSNMKKYGGNYDDLLKLFEQNGKMIERIK